MLRPKPHQSSFYQAIWAIYPSLNGQQIANIFANELFTTKNDEVVVFSTTCC